MHDQGPVPTPFARAIVAPVLFVSDLREDTKRWWLRFERQHPVLSHPYWTARMAIATLRDYVLERRSS